MNVQREIIYSQRRQVLDGENVSDSIQDMITSVADETVMTFVEGEDGTVNVESLDTEIKNIFGMDMSEFIKANKEEPEKISEELQEKALAKYKEKEEEIGSDDLRELERVVLLKVVDEKWMDHIDNMDELKNGIGLRAYGQQDPVVKYRTEGGDMFDEMNADIKVDVTKILMNIRKQGELKRHETARITKQAQEALHSVDNGQIMANEDSKVDRTIRNEEPKVGRNDPCPCGSGKKYKNCCGKNA